MVNNFAPNKRTPVFDIGGGNGYVSKGLINNGFDVVLVDPGISAVKNAKLRGISNIICATTYTANFKSESLPIIGIFDVLEHIENDEKFLTHLFDLLTPGGMLFVTVPAYNFLWSHEDERTHFRRYTLKELKKKICDCGFQISYSTYIFSYLPLFVFLFRTIPFRLKLTKFKNNSSSIKKDHVLPKGLIYKFLNFIEELELKKITNQQKLYFGGSCMLAAQKPSSPL